MREVALLLLMRIQYCRPNLPIPFPLPKPFSFNVSISAVTKESVALKIAFGGHTIQLHLGQRHEQDRAMCPAPFQYISKSGFSFSLRHNNVHKLYTTRKTVRPGSAVANLRASTKRPNPKMGLQGESKRLRATLEARPWQRLPDTGLRLRERVAEKSRRAIAEVYGQLKSSNDG